MRIIFFGTPEFAAHILEYVVRENLGDVVLAITQPDRPIGRKKTVSPTPVKAVAAAHDIPVIQPSKLDRESSDKILATKPDIGLMVAYGNLIPRSFIDAFPKGIVNIHPSLLPKYRGATPVMSAILNGDEETGVSLMVIDEKLDHGAIIGQRKVGLNGDETTPALLKDMEPVVFEMLSDEFVKYSQGEIVPRPQEDAHATFCKEITDDDARIDWHKDVVSIERLVRAMAGVNPAWSRTNDVKFTIHRARISQKKTDLAVGTVTEHDGALAVACQDGLLLADEVQLAGGKPMPGDAFLRGHRNLIGTVLAS